MTPKRDNEVYRQLRQKGFKSAKNVDLSYANIDFEVEGQPIRKHKKNIATRILGWMFISLFLCFVGIGGYFYVTLNHVWANPGSIIKPLNNNEKNDQNNGGKKAEPKPLVYDYSELPERIYYEVDGKVVIKERNPKICNILLIGVDTGAGRGTTAGFQSDVLIVMAVDLENYTASMMSIPRDTHALINNLNSKGDVKRTFYGKVNWAFTYGHDQGKYSYKNARDTVEWLIRGIPVDYHVGVTMDSIPVAVDAVGGVEMISELQRASHGFNKGQKITLTGKNVLDYVRDRSQAGSDLTRTDRQRGFLLAMAKKIKKASLTKQVSLFGQVQSYVNTDLSFPDQITALASIMTKINLEGVKSLRFITTSRSDGDLDPNIHDLTDKLIEMFYIDSK